MIKREQAQKAFDLYKSFYEMVGNDIINHTADKDRQLSALKNYHNYLNTVVNDNKNYTLNRVLDDTIALCVLANRNVDEVLEIIKLLKIEVEE